MAESMFFSYFIECILVYCPLRARNNQEAGIATRSVLTYAVYEKEIFSWKKKDYSCCCFMLTN